MKEKKERLASNPLGSLIRNTSNIEKQDNQDNTDVSSIIEQAEKVSNIGKPKKSDKQDNVRRYIVRTFKIRRVIDEKLNRKAYYEHRQKQVVLDKILTEYFKTDEEYPEIPEEERLD